MISGRIIRSLLRLAIIAAGIAAPTLAFATAWSPVLTVSLLRDDNVTNSIREAKTDSAATAAVSFSELRVVRRDLQGNLGAFAQTVHWDNWDGLDLSEVGITTGLRQKLGLGPYAPKLDLTVSASRQLARTSPWSGNVLRIEAAARRRFTPAFSGAFAAEFQRLDARRAVYSTTAHTLTLRGDYELSADWSLGLAVRRRQGDVVSWCRESWPEWNGTTPWKDGIFGGDWFPYQTDSRTVGLLATVSRAFGPASTLSARLDVSESRAAHHHIFRNQKLSLQLTHAF